MSQKVTTIFSNSTNSAISTVSTGTGMVADAMGNAAGRLYQSMSGSSSSTPSFKDKEGYMSDKLKGNS